MPNQHKEPAVSNGARTFGVRGERVAYFSMEMGLQSEMHTYAGGLGVLAGDTMRTAADMSVPVIGVTLIYHEGHFRQVLDEDGNQSEHDDHWSPEEFLEPMDIRVTVPIEGREVRVRPWRFVVKGADGGEAEVLLLDTDLPENTEEDRRLTDDLYGGDDRYRLRQEALLGLGGVKVLEASGATRGIVYHMNEGHSALLTLGLLERRMAAQGHEEPTEEDVAAVTAQCVFTTHTPVPAGHDKFPWGLVEQVLGAERTETLEAAGCRRGDTLNMTQVALRFSRYVNGVALYHEEVSEGMFPGYPIHCVTNGVHLPTWVSEPFKKLFDQHTPYWQQDNEFVRYAIGIPLDEIRDAHATAKGALLDEVKRRMGIELRPDALTMGFARRATSYKRADLLVSDLDRLRSIVRAAGPLQVVYAGKAHPRDQAGKDIIRRIFAAARQLGGEVPVVYLEDYDMDLARLMCAGSDLWLNVPRKPQEASGTSGMKAALNGVPSFSVLDGWWREGHIEGVTGWAIGDDGPASDDAVERESMYHKLENTILPMFYDSLDDFARVMRYAIALNGSFFNSQRMLSQYLRSAYHISARQQDEV